jgi:hypothetical protein
MTNYPVWIDGKEIYMTLIEVLDEEGALMGFFRTHRPAKDCVGKRPSDFKSVTGEWWPSGGFTHLDAFGANAWYNHAAELGEMKEVSE